MTNYNERLDEILTTCDFEPEGFNSHICKWCGERKGAKIHTAKQAILSLKKEWEIDVLKTVGSVHCGIPTKTLKRADLKDWLVYEINQLNGDKLNDQL